jgi:hypothetical protein
MVEADLPTQLRDWLDGHLPRGWFREIARVDADREEVLVVGRLDEPAASGCDRDEVCLDRIERFREETRQERMVVADQIEAAFGRKVAWGACCGDQHAVFTSLGAPVMTRLRMPERRVLDTLVDAGVARSRSEALAWCVRLVGEHAAHWIDDLRAALVEVERVRADGPDLEDAARPKGRGVRKDPGDA